MSFSLKNTSATYQRLVNKVFERQISRNMKVYIDDILVENIEVDRHITDLEEMFWELHKYQMKLNPNKCAFGVIARKFLNFLIT